LLLLHGDAGSGKSVAIRMIEDFIWKRNDAIKIIPIVVKLSELKDPINNAIVETLRSLNYKLDNSHIE
jgi:RNase adaptor protein for sRNA GlmZ degradation